MTPGRLRAEVSVVLSGWPRVSEVFAAQRAGHPAPGGHARPQLRAEGGRRAGRPTRRWPRSSPVRRGAPPGTVAQSRRRRSPGGWTAGRSAAVHGYFAHEPAAVAAAAARLADLPYGFSTHALDARKTPTARPRERRPTRPPWWWPATTTWPAEIAAVGRRPVLVRHGVDLAAFSPDRPPPDQRPVGCWPSAGWWRRRGSTCCSTRSRGSRADVPAATWSATARCATSWRRRIDRLGLADRVRLLGRQTHATLPGALRRRRPGGRAQRGRPRG